MSVLTVAQAFAFSVARALAPTLALAHVFSPVTALAPEPP